MRIEIQFWALLSDGSRGAGSLQNPIYSTKADDPGFGERIDEFIVHLAERIDVLQDAEFKADFSGLKVLARELVDESEQLGFGSLAASAGVVEGCSEAADPDEIREVLLDLTEIAKRIRLGHRGSV